MPLRVLGDISKKKKKKKKSGLFGAGEVLDEIVGLSNIFVSGFAWHSG